MSWHEIRRERLRRRIDQEGADALLVTNCINVTYLTGFTGDDSYLLIGSQGEQILTDPRYTTQLKQECPKLERVVRSLGVGMVEHTAKLVRQDLYRRLAVEADSMSVGLLDQLEKQLARVKLVRTLGLVENLRMVKDKEEIVRIRQAVRQARRGFEVVRASLTPEQTERQVAAELEHQLRHFGAIGCSFPPIVAVGPQAALPHARPGDRRVRESDFVLIDWGANEGLYLSDLTRIVVTGRISPKLRRIYRVVLKAQSQAIAAIKPGVTCGKVDAVARLVIEKAGYGRAFGHGLGHGIGLAIHEAPRLGRNQKTVLKPGMVVTVEPGVYLPGWGGIRIEDDVLVTRTGHEILSTVPKELDQCVVH